MNSIYVSDGCELHQGGVRYAKYWPILEEFNIQYYGLIAYKKSMSQTVEEWKFEETFEELTVLRGAIAKMNSMLLGFQKNGWVVSAMEK